MQVLLIFCSFRGQKKRILLVKYVRNLVLQLGFIVSNWYEEKKFDVEPWNQFFSVFLVSPSYINKTSFLTKSSGRNKWSELPWAIINRPSLAIDDFKSFDLIEMSPDICVWVCIE